MDNELVILREGNYSQSDLDNLRNQHPIWKQRDFFAEQSRELFEIQNPALRLDPQFNDQAEEFVRSRLKNSETIGSWVYYPWSGFLIRILNEKEFLEIRTNRNKNLVNAEEQEILSKKTVAIAGLSIGNGMALNLVHGGLVRNLKMADFDVLSTANLNRIRAKLSDLENKKIDITSQQIYEADPYMSLTLFDKGLNRESIESFVTGNPKPDLILEAIDDFEMKVRIRLVAKEAKVPVVMLTNLGDSMLIDIERYDTDEDLPIFNGLIGDDADEILSKPMTESDKQRYAISIVGKENVPPRAIASVMEINKTLVGRPQLMSTVTIGSGLAGFVTRKILLGDLAKSGRTKVSFEDFLNK
jgi:hypothetical protein